MKYSREQLAEMAKTVTNQVAVTEDGTFLNAEQYARHKGGAIKIEELLGSSNSSTKKSKK